MEKEIDLKRHSMAHLMAAAVLKLYPQAKFGIGPVVENGFYYDIDFGERNITDSDLKAIEDRMKELAREKQTFTRNKKTKE